MKKMTLLLSRRIGKARRSTGTLNSLATGLLGHSKKAMRLLVLSLSLLPASPILGETAGPTVAKPSEGNLTREPRANTKSALATPNRLNDCVSLSFRPVGNGVQSMVRANDTCGILVNVHVCTHMASNNAWRCFVTNKTPERGYGGEQLVLNGTTVWYLTCPAGNEKSARFWTQEYADSPCGKCAFAWMNAVEKSSTFDPQAQWQRVRNNSCEIKSIKHEEGR